MAVLLGAMMIHGITPSPSLITEHPTMFWGLIMSFWVGNIMLLILNIPLINIWVRMLTIPYKLLHRLCWSSSALAFTARITTSSTSISS